MKGDTMSPEEQVDLILGRLKNVFFIQTVSIFLLFGGIAFGMHKWEAKNAQRERLEASFTWMEYRLERQSLEVLEIVLSAAKTCRRYRPLTNAEILLLGDLGGESCFVRHIDSEEKKRLREEYLTIAEVVLERKRRQQKHKGSW
ncbi:MAG: hypothetical protein OYG31_01765 [Candidatus Kaiserbacteria bacterium]|nr:hypothetical protein [Candidatus Kaiserbacteria bacterium]